MYEILLKRADMAKKAIFPLEALHDVYGQAKMARELEAITEVEFMALNTAIVRNGINNPLYF